MNRGSIQRLLREWAALLAVLAMVLGPLALATSRSLGAAEKVAVASGAKAFVICAPGDPDADPSAKAVGGDCDHCTPVQPMVLGAITGLSERLLAGEGHTGGAVLLRHVLFPRAPPARGPPVA